MSWKKYDDPRPIPMMDSFDVMKSLASYVADSSDLTGGGQADQLPDNLRNLKGYAALLMGGDGDGDMARVLKTGVGGWNTGTSLGRRFLARTPGHCTATEAAAGADTTPIRSTYINTVVDTGTSDVFKGLIGGMAMNVAGMAKSTAKLATAFFDDPRPDCSYACLKDFLGGTPHVQCGYVPDEELEDIAPCAFADNLNKWAGGATCTDPADRPLSAAAIDTASAEALADTEGFIDGDGRDWKAALKALSPADGDTGEVPSAEAAFATIAAFVALYLALKCMSN